MPVAAAELYPMRSATDAMMTAMARSTRDSSTPVAAVEKPPTKCAMVSITIAMVRSTKNSGTPVAAAVPFLKSHAVREATATGSMTTATGKSTKGASMEEDSPATGERTSLATKARRTRPVVGSAEVG